MALTPMEDYRVHVRAPVRANDTYVVLSAPDAQKLNAVGSGNHTYLTLTSPLGSEVIRYDHSSDWGTGAARVQVPVARDQSGRGAMNFPAYSCLLHTVSAPFLADFITGLVGGGNGV